MVIRQGDVFWLELPAPEGSEPGYRHPHVVVQNDVFNSSKINTVVVCAVISNMDRGKSPGNVVLRKGEANLPKASVVNITQVITVNKSDIKEKIGTLTKRRINEIIAGIKLLVDPVDAM